MLIKTSTTEILNVIDPEKIDRDEDRTSILASALDKAKELIGKGSELIQDKTENDAN